MPPEPREGLKDALHEPAALEAAVRDARTRLSRARVAAAALRREKDGGPEVEAADALALRRSDELAEAKAALGRDRERRKGLRETATAIDPAAAAAGMKAAVPLMMIPFRMETKFAVSDTSAELLVRVFPDDLAIETHEDRVNEKEYEAVKSYWTHLWKAGKDLARRKAAWRFLCEAVGAPRAAWIEKSRAEAGSDLSKLAPAGLDARLAEDPLPETAEPALAFPEPEAAGVLLAEGAWTRAPVTRLAPDRWVVRLYRDGALFKEHPFERAIPDPLAVGPVPGDAPATEDPARPPLLDEESAWLMDFEKAVGVGMAARIPLRDAAVARRGFDRVLLFGTKASLSPGEAADRVESWLENQSHTLGVEFLRQGTPTNNTPAAPSTFSSRDPGFEASFAAAHPGAAAPLPPESNAARLSRLLGIAPAAASALPRGTHDQETPARDMAEALWPATWGYHLRRFLYSGPECPYQPEDLPWFRRFFIDHVRARGPLPALRIGRDPFGILPVTNAARWGASDEPAVKMRTLLEKLRSAWLLMAKGAPHVGRTDETDDDFTQTLGMEASPREFLGRALYGPSFLDNLFTFYGMAPEDAVRRAWWNQHENNTAAVLRRFGYEGKVLPPLAYMVFEHDPFRIPLPLVVEGGGKEDAGLSSANYLSELGGLSFEGLRARDAEGTGPSLLYLLLRHSLSSEYARSAFFYLLDPAENAGIDAAEELDPEFLRMGPGRGRSPLELIRGPLREGRSALELVEAASSDGTADSVNERVRDLRSLKDAVQRLGAGANRAPGDPAFLSTSELERLFGETMDACSHRLDAWLTALATSRLEADRGENARGVHLCGFSWLEGVKAEARAPIEVPGEGTVLDAPLNAGYVHAPSVNHAVAAAVLRNAYLTHADAENREVFSVNLSSERARRARWCLSAVRQGQPLGAVLGYRFERFLRDHVPAAQAHIPALREACPLVAGRLTPEDGAQESVAAANVVDGLALLRKRGEGTLGLGQNGLPAEEAFGGAFDALDDDLDSVLDLGLAESVYQAASGNYFRAGAMLDSVSAGAVSPDPEVLSTPRGGVSVTHRVVLLLAEGAAPEGATPREAAEPTLARFAAKALGGLDRIVCRVLYDDPATSEPKSLELRLSEVVEKAADGTVVAKWSPLDLAYLLSAFDGDGGGEVEERLRYHARRSDSSLADADLRVDLSWRGNDGAISLQDALNAARRWRGIFSSSRFLRANDFVPPEETSTAQAATADEAERFADRAEDALDALSAAKTTLDAATPPAAFAADAAVPDLEDLRRAILSLHAFGLSGSIPCSSTGRSAAAGNALREQAVSLSAELAKRQAAGRDAVAAARDEAAGPAQRLDAAQDAFRAAFGRSFAALPAVEPGRRAELDACWSSQDALLGGDTVAALRWTQRAGLAKPRLGAVETATLLSDAVASPNEWPWRVAQLPRVPGERWLGLPLAAGTEAAHGRLSVVALTPDGAPPAGACAGLLIDEWNELIPNSTETTALTFNFNQPGSEAPQALLLGVHPNAGAGNWDWETAWEVLGAGLDLARIRAVDKDALKQFNHYLPAVCLADNAQDDVVATRLQRDAGAAWDLLMRAQEE